MKDMGEVSDSVSEGYEFDGEVARFSSRRRTEARYVVYSRDSILEPC